MIRLTALVFALLFAIPACAGGIEVSDAYARVNSPTAKAGAVFLVLTNNSGVDDRLVNVSTDVAARAELHSNLMSADGVMRMDPIAGGIALQSGERHALERGGDHVMLMGLKRGLMQGDVLQLVLTFEHAEEIRVDVPVDLSR